MGKYEECGTKVRIRPGVDLSQKPVAIFDQLSFGRTDRVEQQPRGAKYKALCDCTEELLFANTSMGAQSSAVIFSLIETAKENGLDPYRYLTWVLAEAPKRSASDSLWAAALMPENAPPQCRVKWM